MKKIILLVAAVAIVFIIGVLIANFLIMPLLVHKGEAIEVPNVCNLPLNEALKQLKQVNLEGVIKERRYDPIIESGNIIIQEPLPGSRVKKGRIINLTVSLGPETLKVPFLTGVNLEKAKLILKNLGLLIATIDSLYSDSIPAGAVIKSLPESGTEIHKGEKIRLIISKGIILKMPNLLGKPLDRAKEILKKLGLVIAEVKSVEGSGEKGTVIIQSPEADKIVNIGDSASLMIIK